MKFNDLPQWIVKCANGSGKFLNNDTIARWFIENCDSLEDAANTDLFTEEDLAVYINKNDLEHDWNVGDYLYDYDELSKYEQYTIPENESRPNTEPDITDVRMTIDEDVIDEYDGIQGVYVLKCEDDNYYIGCSNNIKRRIRQHFSGRGSLWTQRYHPKEIVTVEEIEGDRKDLLERENELTIDVMEEHGWKNVRGGDWWSPFVSRPPERLCERVPCE